jgi:hypothetical protein
VTPARSPTRQRFLEFLIGVAVVHVTAIAVYYAMDVAHWTVSRQRMFAWIWMGATVLVVFVGLQRIKRARAAARAGQNRDAVRIAREPRATD